MEVRKGFKQMEVGVIPENWEFKELRNYFSFISYGFTNPMPTVSDGVYMITANDINNGRIKLETARKTSELAFKTFLSDKSRPKKNDILLTKDGTLGRIALVGDEKICINQSVAVIRPNEKIYPLFLKLLLEGTYYQKTMIDNAGGSTIKHIYITVVDKMNVAIPPTKSEQTAIATALSDADALITSLEKLIEKKRAIKQGAMQKLLKPKEGWQVKKFGEIIIELRGGAPLAPNDFKESGFKVLPKGGVGRGGILSIDNNKQQYCSKEYAANHQTNIVDNKYNIIVLRDLVPSGPSIGLTVKFDTTERYVLAQGVYGYKVNEDKISSDYLIQLSNAKEYRKIMNNIMVGSTQVHIPNSAYLKVSFSFPPTKSEQTRIATILSDMDAEITALERKLAKYKQIKQGMMQELLTGRIRLIQV